MFDAAASTPPTRVVARAVASFMNTYGSIHRGCGARSRASSEAYETARRVVGSHVYASENHSVVFTANTTDAIRLLASALPPGRVLISDIEHSANDLPWRQVGWIVDSFPTVAGHINPESIDRFLSDRRKPLPVIVSITGASNITGQITDLDSVYDVCQRHGIPLFVDCSQRMGHAPTIIGVNCDALAFSGHKIGAPFGAGALVAPTAWLGDNLTASIGGGSVVYTTKSTIIQKPAPYNWESGTPNGVGAVAIAAALRDLDYPSILTHDRLVEDWYRRHVIPYVADDVLWCSGSLLMLRIKQRYLEALDGLEFRYGAFCCYEAFRRVCGPPETTSPLPWDWGGIRLSADPSVVERDVVDVGRRLSAV